MLLLGQITVADPVMMKEFVELLIATLGAVIGVIVGGVFAFKLVRWAVKNWDRIMDERAEMREIREYEEYLDEQDRIHEKRYASDPEYAAKHDAWEAHEERMQLDPEYAAQYDREQLEKMS